MHVVDELERQLRAARDRVQADHARFISIRLRRVLGLAKAGASVRLLRQYAKPGAARGEEVAGGSDGSDDEDTTNLGDLQLGTDAGPGYVVLGTRRTRRALAVRPRRHALPRVPVRAAHVGEGGGGGVHHLPEAHGLPHSIAIAYHSIA